MEPTIKIIATTKNVDVNTWNDFLEKPIDEIINNLKKEKNWIIPEILDAYIEFNLFDQKAALFINSGQINKYYKIYVDIKKQKLNELLNS